MARRHFSRVPQFQGRVPSARAVGRLHTVHPVRDAGSVVWKMSILSPWFAAPSTTVSLFHSLALIVLMLTIARGSRTQMRWNAFKMSRVG